MSVHDLTVPASDGYPLAATLYEPDAPGSPAALVVVTSATAVKRSFYARYASYLAGPGLAVVTFDYRGVGGSRPGRLRGFPARMRDWAQRDTAGVLEWAAAREPRPRLLLVGHSFGGQALGLLPRPGALDAALLVAAQSGYWGHWPPVRRLGLAAFWHVVMPGLVRLLGFFPGRALGMGQDLPAGVALDWARWGRCRDYLDVDRDAGWRTTFARLRLPIRAYSFADDGYAPRAAVDALLDLLPGARVERVHRVPVDLGVRRIGHWGFFREAFRDTLWRESRDWLRAQVEADERSPGPAREA